MESQEYMRGDWELLPKHCWPQDDDDMATYSYAYDVMRGCNEAVHLCEPGASVCAWKANHLARWQWQPATCRLRTFNSRELARITAGQRILFLGDSLMVEQFDSLKALMQKEVKTSIAWDQFETISDGQFEVHGLWHIVGRGNEAQATADLFNIQDQEWRHKLQKADILVFNTGHHWHRLDPDFLQYQKMVRAFLATLASDFQGSSVIFRTSPWGHYNCSQAVRPVREFVLPAYDYFQWGKPIMAESVWADLAQSDLNPSLNFQIANASITRLRADGHIDRRLGPNSCAWEDCLHGCLPGPADYWNWLVFNILMAGSASEWNSKHSSRHSGYGL